MKHLSKGWKAFLILSFIAGLFLRTLYVNDMEYKEDEQYNFTQSQTITSTHHWPAYGIPSGVYIVNPGMSIWVFAALAEVSGSTTPTELARALQIFSLLGICLLLPFTFLFIKNANDREPWLWAFALAMVNPLSILYQRKLWPEPFLPFFSMLVLMGWWKRENKWGAFVWGLVGAVTGQIHMSGFFAAFALFGWTLAFNRKNVRWSYWFAGSILGALPLIPWLQYLVTHPTHMPMEHNWNEALQFKYWVFWISDSFGIHLGNTLGIYRGDTHIEQLSDFIRYPLIAGHATYLVGLAHLTIIGCMIWFALRLARWTSTQFRKNPVQEIIGRESSGKFAGNSIFLGSGILMTLTNVNIRRYYMMVTFPFEQFWLARFCLPDGRKVLALLWLAQFWISANFVGYIHVNQGSPQGDYGDAYHVILEKSREKNLVQARAKAKIENEGNVKHLPVSTD